MQPLHVIVLALVQAVTEFLPISSSGHLILVPRLLGWPDQGLSFDIAANTGTLLAVVAYFRRDLAEIGRGLLGSPLPGRGPLDERARLGWLLALGTVPAVLAGAVLHSFVATTARNPVLIAVDLIVYGLLLAWADRRGRQGRDLGALGWRDALLVGAAQALALLPGTSRSGVTMTAALLLGLTRPAAARFSFLLAVPVGILAEAKDLFDHARAGAVADLGPMLLGIAVAAAAGYAVIAWLLAWLRTRTLTVFVVYRIVFGVVLLVVAAR